MKKKLYLSFILTLVISGCSNPFSKAKPKEPSHATNSNVKVIETVPSEPTNYVVSTDHKTTAQTTSTKSKDASNSKENTQKEKTTKKTYHKIKPEPYSVGSQESDPELLGTQGSLKDKLKEKTEEI